MGHTACVVSIPYPAGMALWPFRGCFTTTQLLDESQSPIQRGWLCGGGGGNEMEKVKRQCLNPLSSGDGFVARTPWTYRERRILRESQSPIQRGWPCGQPGEWTELRMPKVSIPYPAGMALWHNGLGDRYEDLAMSQSPIQRGWLCGIGQEEKVWEFPWSSQSPIQRGWLCGPRGGGPRGHPPRVSIPYPAGMALWRAAEALAATRREVSIPYPAGMALWRPCSSAPRWRRSSVSIPYPAGMALWRRGARRDRPVRLFVSIPYPAGMALWHRPQAAR